MSIDWWAIIVQSIGTSLQVWGGAIAANPWPWVGLAALAALGMLIPAGRRRRRY